MNGMVRRAALAALACGALLVLAAAPASAQVEGLYTGVTPPARGGVLAASGERVLVPTGGVQGQVLPLQVSGGVAAAQGGRGGGLALTGSDVASLVAIGLSAVVVGAVVTRRARPRPTSPE